MLIGEGIVLYYYFPVPANALLAQEALAYFRDRRLRGQVLGVCLRVEAEWSLGNYALAESLAKEAREASTEDPWHEEKITTQLWLVRIALSQGKPHLAGELLNGLIGSIIKENDGYFWFCQNILEAIGLLKIAYGQMIQAVRMFGASDKYYQIYALGVTQRRRSEREGALTSLRAALSKETLEREWQAGQAMTMWQAIEWVRSETNPGSDAGPVP